MPEQDRYCPGCGSPLEAKDMEGQQRPACSGCGRVIYYDPKVTAAALVPQDGKVLLVRRNNEPGLGLWSLPGGYVDRGEVVEQAAAREVWEETGLEVEVKGLVGLFSEAGQPVILAAYQTQVIGGRLQPGPEALDVAFFEPHALPPLAFPRDKNIIEEWWKGNHSSPHH